MAFPTRPPAPSTSTTGRPSRFAIRPKAPTTLTALVLQEPQVVTLPSGHAVPGRVGDVLIYRGNQSLYLLTPQEYEKTYEPVEDGLLLRPETRAKLEEKLGLGSTQSVESLFRALDRLARIQVGEIRIDFTAGQLEELSLRAKKRNQDLATYLARLLERFSEDLWKISAA